MLGFMAELLDRCLPVFERLGARAEHSDSILVPIIFRDIALAVAQRVEAARPELANVSAPFAVFDLDLGAAATDQNAQDREGGS